MASKKSKTKRRGVKGMPPSTKNLLSAVDVAKKKLKRDLESAKRVVLVRR